MESIIVATLVILIVLILIAFYVVLYVGASLPHKHWVICCAFSLEYDELIKCFDQQPKSPYRAQDAMPKQNIENGIKYAMGTIQDLPCILCNTGISITNASRATQWIIDRFSSSKISGISFIGIGGSINDRIVDGDVSCPFSWIDYGHQLYIGKGELPKIPQPIAYTPPFTCSESNRYVLKTYRLSDDDEEIYFTRYRVDPNLFEVAKSMKTDLDYLDVGGIGTSASIFQADPTYIDYLKSVISTDLVVADEETTAVAHVCSFYFIPWICFRLVSDFEASDFSGSSTETPLKINRLRQTCESFIAHLKQTTLV